jgi:hypothetical protein
MGLCEMDGGVACLGISPSPAFFHICYLLLFLFAPISPCSYSLRQLDLLAECPNRKNPDAIFFKVFIPFMDLVEIWYFRPFGKIVEGGVDALFACLAFNC